MVFHTKLGTNAGEIGNNLEMLKNAFKSGEEFYIGDYLDTADNFMLHKGRLYIADKYNKCISIFSLVSNKLIDTIPNKGKDYSFDRPFQFIINKYGERFVLASVETNIENITEDYNNYYIYKFSPDNDFLYRIGEEGINSKGMYYPFRIDYDQYDNIYAYYKILDTNSQSWIVKRFSSSGELNFIFDSRYILQTSEINNEDFNVNITDIYNMKNDERLLLYTEYDNIREPQHVLTNNVYFNSVDFYSILQNTITSNIIFSETFIDQILGITSEDVIVFYSFDEKYKLVRFRFINPKSTDKAGKEEIFYAPIISFPYVLIGYIIDENGEIYTAVVKDNEYFILLHWKKNRAYSQLMG